jgi:hypothetical protein
MRAAIYLPIDSPPRGLAIQPVHEIALNHRRLLQLGYGTSLIQSLPHHPSYRAHRRLSLLVRIDGKVENVPQQALGNHIVRVACMRQFFVYGTSVRQPQ